jgi:type VI secretion system protein
LARSAVSRWTPSTTGRSEILSVQQNIRRILNARAGALKHLPDYGLPDLTNIYKALPASAHLLRQQMEATLLV